MVWKLAISPGARQDLKKIEKLIQQTILRKLAWLTENFSVINHEQLHGPLSKYQKLRVGDYRVVYVADHKEYTLYINAVQRRDKVYKRPGRK